MSAATDQAPPSRNYCWIPTMDLEPGMITARPVFGRMGKQLAIHLAIGTPITASTISQLLNKGVECIAVESQAPIDEAMHAEAVARYEARLREIFGPEPDAHCAPLLAALLADGPQEC